MRAESDRIVVLAGGLVVAIDAIVLLLSLEERGYKLWRDGPDIVIEPFSTLTDEDKRQLRALKGDILALLDYQPPTLVQ